MAVPELWTLGIVRMLQIVDTFFLVLAFMVPIFCVVRWNLKGAFIGAAFFWAILLLSGFIIAAFDAERGSSVVDGAWLVLGWLAGLIYSFLIYGLKRLYLYFRAKTG